MTKKIQYVAAILEGLEGSVLHLFKSYLSDRRQVVMAHGATSQVAVVRTGVPQGSALGPLLFLILMNDLVLDQKALLYADDTTLISSGSEIKTIKHEASQLFESAKSWFGQNYLQLNEDKTQSLFCSLWTRPNACELHDDNTAVKLLGVVLDSKLNWGPHIDEVCKKLSRVNYLLRKLKSFVSPAHLLTAYFGLFHCHIAYGLVLWGHAPCSKRVLLLQKAAIRIITSSGPRDHCRPLFSSLGVLTVHSQFILNSLMLVKNNPNWSLMTRQHHHQHNLRSKTDIHVPRCRLGSTMDSNPSMAYRLFNRLPENVRVLETQSFKTKMTKWLKMKSFYSIEEYLNTSEIAIL